MALRCAYVNTNFNRGGDRALLREVCSKTDVVFCSEAKNIDLDAIAPHGWTAYQVMTNDGTRGSGLLVRDAAATLRDFGIAHSSGPVPKWKRRGMGPRYTAHGMLTERATGAETFVMASHWPPGWFREIQPEHTAVVRRLMAGHDSVILGADVNQDVKHVAAKLRLRGYGPDRKGADRDVVGIFTNLPVTGYRAERIAGTDHHVIFAAVALTDDDTDPGDPMSDDLTLRVVARARQLGCTVYTHDQWGARYGATYNARLKSRPVLRVQADTLFGHITVTRDDGLLPGEFFADMREVEQIGMARFGSGFSYNFGLDMNTGEIGVGQWLRAKGTHTVNDKRTPGYSHDQNAVARAIAGIGMPGYRFTADARLAWVRLLAAMILEGALTESPDVVPHSLVAAKDCPTDAIRRELPSMKRDALALVKEIRGGGPDPTDPEPVDNRVTRMRGELAEHALAARRARDQILTAVEDLKKVAPDREVVRARIPHLVDAAKAFDAVRDKCRDELQKLPKS